MPLAEELHPCPHAEQSASQRPDVRGRTGSPFDNDLGGERRDRGAEPEAGVRWDSRREWLPKTEDLVEVYDSQGVREVRRAKPGQVRRLDDVLGCRRGFRAGGVYCVSERGAEEFEEVLLAQLVQGG